MVKSVGDDQQPGTHHEVVAGYLVEYLGGDFHSGSLIFDNNERARRGVGSQEGDTVVNHRVASASRIVDFQRHFVGHQSLRVAKLINHEGGEMPAHELLGSKRHELGAKRVVDASHPVGIHADAQFNRWQIQWIIHDFSNAKVALIVGFCINNSEDLFKFSEKIGGSINKQGGFGRYIIIPIMEKHFNYYGKTFQLL